MMHIDNLAEESGNISFVEYTATGIFILKIEKENIVGRKYNHKFLNYTMMSR